MIRGRYAIHFSTRNKYNRRGLDCLRGIMEYRKLGRTSFEVSEMAHGLWGMSGWSGSDDRESLDSLQLAADLGCNFFDTAWAYGEGKSDGLLGQVLSKNASPPNPSKRLH